MLQFVDNPHCYQLDYQHYALVFVDKLHVIMC